VLANKPLPSTEEVNCDQLDALYRSPPAEPVLVIVYADDCAAPSHPATSFVHRFRAAELMPPRLVVDSLRVDVLLLPVATISADR
jgi:hypothetical protein